jgi:phosphohistidine phosphatase SixA
MGKLLRDQNITPDLIISSTAIRAETTAKLVAKACKYKGEIIFDKSVYNTEPIKYVQGQMDHLSKSEKALLQDIKQKEGKEEPSEEIAEGKTTNGVF